MIRQTTARLLAVVIVGAMAAAACTDGNDERTRSRSAEPANTATGSGAATTPTSTLAEAAKRDALAAFDAMWQDMALASEKADYQSPVLARHASGQALDLVVRSVYSFKLEGQVTRGRPIVEGRVTALTPQNTPTTASIVGCVDSTNWLEYDADTLKRTDDPPGGPHRSTATVTLINGVWRVTKFRVEGTGTC